MGEVNLVEPQNAPARARSAYTARDYAALVEIVDEHALDVWYGIEPNELRPILTAVPTSILESHPLVLVLRSIFVAADDASNPVEVFEAARPASLEADPRLWCWLLVARALRARLRGDAKTAYAVIREAPQVTQAVTQLVDPTDGFHPFVLAQAATAAALAGEFAEALTLYERLVLVPPRPGYEFIIRRAHERLALLHGLFGDRAAARIHHSRAHQVPRSTSWVEPLIDSEARLVESLLLIDVDVDAAAEQALQLSYEPMGEFWPFFVMTASRAAVTASRSDDARARFEALRATGIAGPGASGLGASVFGQEMGFDAVLRGNVVQARDELASADPDHWRTHILSALVALLASNPRQAMREVAAAEPQTRGLRQAEQRRLAVLAIARLADDDQDGSIEVLTRVANQLGSFDHALLTILSPSLMSRVEHGVPGVQRDPRWMRTPHGILDRPRLSASELNVLAGLNRGQTREEIAESLFVSANTVKSHLASLYRKLGVSSAGAAVTEATRLELL